MTGRATDGIVLAGPGDRWEEFGNDEAVGGLLDVLAEGPPSKVVNLLDVGVRAVEERNVVLEEIPRRRVGDVLRVVLGVVLVKGVNIMPIGLDFKHGRLPRRPCGTKCIRRTRPGFGSPWEQDAEDPSNGDRFNEPAKPPGKPAA